MTFLAYDPTLLLALRREMASAVDELDACRSDDPEAFDAMRVMRRAAADLRDHWLPVLQRVLSDAPLEREVPRAHDLDALESALARQMAVTRGWAVAPDPSADDVVGAQEATALADRLATQDLATIAADDATMQWLTARWRRIASDPVVAAAFLEHFPQWTALADELGRHRALLVQHAEPSPSLALGTVDDALTAWGAVLHVGGAHTRVLDDVTAYTAALLLRSLGLTGSALAAATDHVMLRPREASDDLPAANRADVLLQNILRDPVACTGYLALALDHPATLFDHVSDPSLAHRVVLKATDPRFVDDATAGVLVPAVIATFANDPSRDPGVLLADLVAPWTVQFSPTNHTWPIGTDQRNALLEIALSGDGALQRFIDDRAQVISGARHTLSSGAAHDSEMVAGWVGLIGALVMNERMNEANLRRKSWDLLCNVAALGASFVKSAALGVALSIAVVMIHDHLGPDVEPARRDAVWGKSAALTIAAQYLADEVHTLWVAQGRLPERFPGPPKLDRSAISPSEEWYNDFEDWMELLPGGINGHMANDARHVVWAVLSPSLVGDLSGQA